MESLNLKIPSQAPKDRLFCLIRRVWVVASPEEKLRQRVLRYMCESGGYPKGLLSVEVPLGEAAPDRRADIVSYRKNASGDLTPLLLVECKSERILPNILQQVGGYNFFLKASFLALASQKQSYWGQFDATQKRYIFRSGFPLFSELLHLLNTIQCTENHLGL